MVSQFINKLIDSKCLIGVFQGFLYFIFVEFNIYVFVIIQFSFRNYIFEIVIIIRYIKVKYFIFFMLSISYFYIIMRVNSVRQFKNNLNIILLI